MVKEEERIFQGIVFCPGDPELVAIIANGALDSANWLTYEGGVSWK